MPTEALSDTWQQVRPYRLPGLFMVLAPLSVVAALVLTQDVLVAFAVYHVGMCLVVPIAYEKLVRGDTWHEISHELGLARLDEARPWLVGLGVGAAMCLGILASYLLLGKTLIQPDDVAQALAGWAIGPEDTAFLFGYMLVFNSGAEELFWRGYIHERLAGWSNRWAALVAASAAFASYHWFTVWALTGEPLIATVVLGGVFIGGLTWAYLREKEQTVLPALLGHLGATLGYMTVYAVYLV